MNSVPRKSPESCPNFVPFQFCLNVTSNQCFSVDEAEAEYEKGRKLLETADKLMAMVHAAKMEAEQYDDKIIGLVEKAEAIYSQLSELAQQFGDGSGDVE